MPANKLFMYRWMIKTDNIFDFIFLESASHFATDKNQVSGWIPKSKVLNLMDDLKATGKTYSNFRLVSHYTFWKNFDKY